MTKKYGFLLFVCLLVATTDAFSATWKRIYIPGAKCGNGSAFSVFVRPNSPDKLLIEFMGGGACWDQASCLYRTWIYPVPQLNSYGAMTDQTNPLNPFKDSSTIYIPYCTGDVYAGDYTAQYSISKINHWGHKNVRLALDHLVRSKIVDFKAFNDVAVLGSSAGAIGSLLHVKYIDGLLKPEARRTLIADSPGLHFGATFWDRFGTEARTSFQKAFDELGLRIDFNDGFIARKIAPILDSLTNWKIGFLYGERDAIMSEYFGQISKTDYQNLLLGAEGIVETSKRYSNVNVWLSDSDNHIFLLFQDKYNSKSVDGVPAIGFVKNIHESNLGN
tara:strand:- start:31425 stop:32420 length:996 start_codon:yes stop_codon:yes gene_type:complete